MLRRPMMLSAVFLLAGILINIFEVNIWLVASAAVSFVVWFLGIKREKLSILVICFIFLFAGFTRTALTENYKRSVVRKYDGKSLSLTLTAAEFSDDGKIIASFSESGRTYKVYLSSKTPVSVECGSIIKGRVSLSEPYSDKVGSGGFSEYLSGRGIYLYGKAKSLTVCGYDEKGADCVIYRIRRYIDRVGEEHFSGDSRALFNAMVIGDKHLMNGELTRKLQKSGLSHVAVVSGMHLSIAVAAITFLLRKLFGRKRGGVLITIAGILVMTFLTGAGASVVRAAVMCIIFCLAQLFRRENDALSSLSLAFSVMCLYNPYVILNVGFILSVSAVLGILIYNKKISESVKSRLSGFVGETASVSLSAQLMTTLPVVFFFGIITPYAVLSNIMVVLFANGTVVSGMLFSLFAKLPLFGDILAFIVKFCTASVKVVCDFTASLPHATGEIEFCAEFVVLWVYLLILVYYGVKNISRLLRITAVFSAVMLVVVSIQSYSGRSINVKYLNYGKENMTAVFTPDGESILIDCPDAADAMAVSERYDCIVLTSDDSGEADIVASGDAADLVIAPEAVVKTSGKRMKLKELEKSGVRVLYLTEDEAFTLGNTQIRLVSSDDFSKSTAEIASNGETFVSMQAYEHKDIEVALKENLYLDCDALLIPYTDMHDLKSLSRLTNGEIIKRKNFTLKKQ